jgi:hypothetical protein
MNRKFFALLAFITFAVTVGGMSCLDTVADLNTQDETDGAT